MYSSPFLAPAILLSHHRDFLSFVRKKNVSVNPLAQDLHLNRIDLGNNFNAVEGVFSDHAFLDYLYKQSTVEYVESNQVYKTTVVGSKQRRAEEEEEEDEGLEEDEDGLIDSGTDNQTISSTLKKGKPSNWGLARIHQRQRGDFEKYVFDSIGGYVLPKERKKEKKDLTVVNKGQALRSMCWIRVFMLII